VSCSMSTTRGGRAWAPCERSMTRRGGAQAPCERSMTRRGGARTLCSRSMTHGGCARATCPRSMSRGGRARTPCERSMTHGACARAPCARSVTRRGCARLPCARSVMRRGCARVHSACAPRVDRADHGVPTAPRTRDRVAAAAWTGYARRHESSLRRAASPHRVRGGETGYGGGWRRRSTGRIGGRRECVVRRASWEPRRQLGALPEGRVLREQRRRAGLHLLRSDPRMLPRAVVVGRVRKRRRCTPPFGSRSRPAGADVAAPVRARSSATASSIRTTARAAPRTGSVCTTRDSPQPRSPW
jgi:hypothetical protein